MSVTAFSFQPSAFGGQVVSGFIPTDGFTPIAESQQPIASLSPTADSQQPRAALWH